MYRSKVNAAASYQHHLCYLHDASTIIALPCTCNAMPNFCDIQEQAEVLLKLISAANPHALPHLPDAAAPALPSAQTAANIASTSASASASASAPASASASASPTVSDPPTKAAAPSSTPTSPGKQTQTAISATVSPPKAPPFEVASESDTPAESGSHDQHRFPHVGLIDASPRMVHTLMLQCLLPCLSPDHDFGQLVYAPWLHYLVLSAGQLLDKSTEGTQQAALMLHMLPCIELAGENLFVDCRLCALPSDDRPSILPGRTILQSYMCIAKRSNMSLSAVDTDLVPIVTCICVGTTIRLQHQLSFCNNVEATSGANNQH